MILVSHRHSKRLKGLGAFNHLDSIYTMVEAFASKDQKRIHVYSLARCNPDGVEDYADNNLYLSELITVPAAYKGSQTVDPFDDTGVMTDLEFFSDDRE